MRPGQLWLFALATRSRRKRRTGSTRLLWTHLRPIQGVPRVAAPPTGTTDGSVSGLSCLFSSEVIASGDSMTDLVVEELLANGGIRRAKAYRPLLEAAFRQYANWLCAQGRMTFFTEFTDHGIRHLSRVLNLADFLICDGASGRPKSWQVVSDEDLLVLAGAILYLDIGMYLTRAGFVTLVNDAARPLVHPPWDRPWSVLWEAYLEESRHWEERTIRRLFGDLPWYHRESPQRLLPILASNDELTGCQTLLIGEFIRRHHPRLAH